MAPNPAGSAPRAAPNPPDRQGRVITSYSIHYTKLYEALGQKYVGYLLGGDIVSNNLVLMIAAYNGGPGNIARWQREVKHDSDPLIFIESTGDITANCMISGQPIKGDSYLKRVKGA